MTPQPHVYCWGGGVTSVPSTLPGASDFKISSVAAGRMQRGGVTEEGKLVFWEVGRHCQAGVFESCGRSATTVFTKLSHEHYQYHRVALLLKENVFL